jgi:hypothetical protein
VLQTSAYTRAAMSDVVRAAPFVALGAAVAATVASRRGRETQSAKRIEPITRSNAGA